MKLVQPEAGFQTLDELIVNLINSAGNYDQFIDLFGYGRGVWVLKNRHKMEVFNDVTSGVGPTLELMAKREYSDAEESMSHLTATLPFESRILRHDRFIRSFQNSVFKSQEPIGLLKSLVWDPTRSPKAPPSILFCWIPPDYQYHKELDQVLQECRGRHLPIIIAPTALYHQGLYRYSNAYTLAGWNHLMVNV